MVFSSRIGRGRATARGRGGGECYTSAVAAAAIVAAADDDATDAAAAATEPTIEDGVQTGVAGKRVCYVYVCVVSHLFWAPSCTIRYVWASRPMSSRRKVSPGVVVVVADAVAVAVVLCFCFLSFHKNMLRSIYIYMSFSTFFMHLDRTGAETKWQQQRTNALHGCVELQTNRLDSCRKGDNQDRQTVRQSYRQTDT